MNTFGMGGGERLRHGIVLAVLAITVLVLGSLAIGAAGEGNWPRAAATIATAAAASAVALLRQAYGSRLPGVTARVIYAVIAGGGPGLLGVIGLLYGFGSLFVGDTAPALFGLAIASAGGFSGWLAWRIYVRSGRRVLSPFHPLDRSIFDDEPDPPAYPRPRELRTVPRGQTGLLNRIKRLLRLDRS